MGYRREAGIDGPELGDRPVGAVPTGRELPSTVLDGVGDDRRFLVGDGGDRSVAPELVGPNRPGERRAGEQSFDRVGPGGGNGLLRPPFSSV